MRKIIHIDMDAFFAAIEQRDSPKLKGKPVVISGPPNSRSVVCTCSYEARQYGIHSAMPASQVYQKCPHAIFIAPRFEVYKKVSKEIQLIFQMYTELVEPLSLDEAYLDVTHCRRFKGSATLIANDIRATIYQKTGLTASAGVSYNKMLAKIASDINKPNGIYVIPPQEAQAFIDQLPIHKFFGVGKKTAAHFIELGISDGATLRKTDVNLLKEQFGKRGVFYHEVAQGIDDRPVEAHRIRKSIGSEETFAHDLFQYHEILNALFEQNKIAYQILESKKLKSRTLTIKLKDQHFKTITKRQSVDPYFLDEENTRHWIQRLLDTVTLNKGIRLLGVSYSNFTVTNKQQLVLF